MTEDAPLGGGFKMLSGAFLNVGKNGCKLSALIPTGYLENDDMEDGTVGAFNIQCLTPDGKVGDIYDWVHSRNWKTGDWNNDAHWKTPAGNVVFNPSTGEYDNDITFAPGTGFYFKCPEKCDEEEEDYKLVMNGEVNQSPAQITFLNDKDTHEGGFQCLGNPYPTSIKLSSLVPEGYDENTDMEEGTVGAFNIQCLGPDGKVGDIYDWVHSRNWKTGDWNDDAHWKTPAGNVVWNETEKKFDNDVEFKSGEGFYFKSPDHVDDEDTPYTMTLTYPLAK